MIQRMVIERMVKKSIGGIIALVTLQYFEGITKGGIDRSDNQANKT